jgi:hypothetical protein
LIGKENAPIPHTDDEVAALAGMLRELKPKQQAFLAGYSRYGTISQAADHAICSERSHWVWLKNELYAELFQTCKDRFADRLEAEAYRRAVTGWDEVVGVDRSGSPVTKTRYDGRLLEILLKAHRPEKFSEAVRHGQKTDVEMINKIVIESRRGDLADPKKVLNRSNGNGSSNGNGNGNGSSNGNGNGNGSKS